MLFNTLYATRKTSFMWKKFKIYSIKNKGFDQKMPCVLRDFVPRDFFRNPGRRGGP